MLMPDFKVESAEEKAMKKARFIEMYEKEIKPLICQIDNLKQN